MPVVIGINGEPVLWGSAQRGLSASERKEYDELHARHRTDDEELHRLLSSGNAWMLKALNRQADIPLNPIKIKKIETLCQRLELTRQALRAYLADPNITCEWTWRYWVGREIGEIRGTGCVDITPGMPTSWGSDGFACRPDLTPEQHAHAQMLLEQWRKIVERLRADGPWADLGAVQGDPKPRLSLQAGGRLLSQIYAYEQALLPYSAYPSSSPPLPLPAGIIVNVPSSRKKSALDAEDSSPLYGEFASAIDALALRRADLMAKKRHADTNGEFDRALQLDRDIAELDEDVLACRALLYANPVRVQPYFMEVFESQRAAGQGLSIAAHIAAKSVRTLSDTLEAARMYRRQPSPTAPLNEANVQAPVLDGSPVTSADAESSASTRTAWAPQRRGRFPNADVFRRDVGEAIRFVAQQGNPSRERVALQMEKWSNERADIGYTATSARAILTAGNELLGLKTWAEIVAELS